MQSDCLSEDVNDSAEAHARVKQTHGSHIRRVLKQKMEQLQVDPAWTPTILALVDMTVRNVYPLVRKGDKVMETVVACCACPEHSPAHIEWV